jgi:translation initiation factor eIF-2B subunit beta
MISSSLFRQLSGGHACAKATIELLRAIVGQLKFSCTEQMIRAVKAIGHGLCQASPTELTIGNVIRRILHLIREEHQTAVTNLTAAGGAIGGSAATKLADTAGKAVAVSSAGSIFNMTNSNIIRQFSGETGADPASMSTVHNTESGKGLLPEMRQNLLASINEYIDEIDSITGPICELAQDHIHAGECILTIGLGGELFLKAAARKRKFQVIVAENAPSLDGHKLVAVLSKACPNITVTLIPDSAIYAIMCRVNKVLLSSLAVVADGGAICNSGCSMVATAAKEFNIPVVCLSASYMLTPLFAHTQDQLLSQLKSPAEICEYNTEMNMDKVEVIIPIFDYLPPSLISIYVTNNGSHQPSYIYRLLSESYDPQDYNF